MSKVKFKIVLHYTDNNVSSIDATDYNILLEGKILFIKHTLNDEETATHVVMSNLFCFDVTEKE